MDKKYIEEKEVITRYLLNQLEGEELSKFTLLLMRDKTLQKEVETQRVLFKTLWKPDKELPLKKNTSSKTNSLWKYLLAALILLVILCLWWMRAKGGEQQPNQQVPGIQFEPPEQEKEQIKPTDIDLTPAPLLEKRPSDSEQLNPQVNPQVSEPQADKQLHVISPSQPIAAHFIPLPALEKEIDVGFRGGDYQFRLSKPEPEELLTIRNKHVRFKVVGKVRTAHLEDDAAFQLLFFSNDPHLYADYASLFNWPIVLTSGEDGYRFSLDKYLDLEPGVYYYLIEEKESGYRYWVGKVRVE